MMRTLIHSHTITLSNESWQLISDSARLKGHSISQELEYLITHQKHDEDTFKTIFKELAELKKQVQERFQ